MREGIKKHKPILFVQSCGTYPDQILVCAGASKKDVVAFNKKRKPAKAFREWLEKDDDLYKRAEKADGLFAWNEDARGYVIFLKAYHDCWAYWETLIHELHHAVERISHQKHMHHESEATAYLEGFLFNSIRRKLQGVDPK
jgi:Holliday junction resolvase